MARNTAVNDEYTNDNELFAAMDRASSPPVTPPPASILGKRPRTQAGSEMTEGEDDPSEGDGQPAGSEPLGDGLGRDGDTGSAATTSGTVSTGLSNANGYAAVTRQPQAPTNAAQMAQRLVKRAKLRQDLAEELNEWINAEPWKRNLLTFVKQLQVEQKLDKIVVSQPEFKISDTLDKHLKQVANAILLSTRLGSYRGAEASTHAENIVDKRRYNIPPNVQRGTPEWDKIRSRIQYLQTQTRASWKRAINKSVEKDDPKAHEDIYTLTMAITSSGQCTVTPQLCGRVAMMRQVHILKKGEDDREYWIRVDKRLKYLRDKAGGDQKKLNKIFKQIIKDDRVSHGTKTGEDIDEVLQNNQQQQIDDALEPE